MDTSKWDPGLYARFLRERTRPAIDLAHRLGDLLTTAFGPLEHPSILDVGCGPGNSTGVLRSMFRGAGLVGIDHSQEMIDAAMQSDPSVEWILADAFSWTPERTFHAIFANASLQWFPDPRAYLIRAKQWLEPGGVIAVQIPGNDQSPLHLTLRRTAEAARFASYFEELDKFTRYEPGYYFESLVGECSAVDVWETTYYHLLPNHEAMLDWYRGTGMRPWMEALPDDETRTDFVDSIQIRIRESYTARPDGTVFLPFRRIFMTAAAG